MIYIVIFLMGLTVGIAILTLILWTRFQIAREREASASERIANAKETGEALDARRRELDSRAATIEAESKKRNDELAQEIERVGARRAKLEAEQLGFSSRVISFRNLQDENGILKRDLQNIDVTINKLEIDRNLQAEKQRELDERGTQLARRFLDETVRWVGATIGPNNFASCKQRLLNAMQWSRQVGFIVSKVEEERLIGDLKEEFERAVRAEFEREEQARIKAQIREEERVTREIEQELKRLDRERIAIQAALDRALAEATDKHDEEIQRLQARLAEAVEKSQRAMSMAQQTKSGNVYVISNIGSFGENVFKIGMTRRLEPMERIRELGGASVPFPFDVHMMIRCDDAPSLENALHRGLHKLRMNRANPRKEFFKVDIKSILEIVRKHHGDVLYIADAAALDYRQSLTMSEEDSEFILQTYDRAEEEEKVNLDILD